LVEAAVNVLQLRIVQGNIVESRKIKLSGKCETTFETYTPED